MNRKYTNTEELLINAIQDEIKQLDWWAFEAISGGWSRHQVDPMRKRANYFTRSFKDR